MIQVENKPGKAASERKPGELLSAKYTLLYADYRDNLDEQAKWINDLIKAENARNEFWNKSGEMNVLEAEIEAIDYQMKEIEEEMGRKLTEEEKEELEEEIRQRDDSYVSYYDGVIRNTNRRYFYYDLGIEASLFGKKDYTETAIKIARKLKIDYKKNKDKIVEMLRNSFYGGQVVVLFVAELRDILKTNEKIKENFITFKKSYEIIVMDRGQGGGTCGDGFIPVEKEITIAFNRQNLNDDIGDAGYSYSKDVCNMIGWNPAELKIGYKPTGKKPKENKDAENFRKMEELYEKRFKEGKCSFGDMKFSRHKNAPYSNDYPCGNKCVDCGTLWID